MIVFATFFFALVFWESSFLRPFKLFAVGVHEIFHSLVALMFQVDSIQMHVYPNESGNTKIYGDLSLLQVFFIASAGYLGTAISSMWFLRACIKEEHWKMYYILFSGLIFLLSFIFIPFGSLGFWILWGGSLILGVAFLFSQNLAFGLFVFLQSFLLFYSFYDLLDFRSDSQNSDVYVLYQFLKQNYFYNGDFEVFQKVITTFWGLVILWFFYKLILTFLNFDQRQDEEPPKELPTEQVISALPEKKSQPEENPLEVDIK
ncbi:MAG: M50 family metallopeptidase [Leptospiraceae bacterium]|nr:M50 family metallopeptidase [Leptospiraceae bacterium]MDW7976822.1 M50 family metallopeptidase [Leptospiraceae bacterium]